MGSGPNHGSIKVSDYQIWVSMKSWEIGDSILSYLLRNWVCKYELIQLEVGFMKATFFGLKLQWNASSIVFSV